MPQTLFCTSPDCWISRGNFCSWTVLCWWSSTVSPHTKELIHHYSTPVHARNRHKTSSQQCTVMWPGNWTQNTTANRSRRLDSHPWRTQPMILPFPWCLQEHLIYFLYHPYMNDCIHPGKVQHLGSLLVGSELAHTRGFCKGHTGIHCVSQSNSP